MKKILFLLLLSVSIYGQNPTPFTKIKITGNTTSATATKVNVQETNGEINSIAKADLIEYLEYASAVNLPVTGVAGKLYITKDDNKLYRWNSTVYTLVSDTDISSKANIASPTFTGIPAAPTAANGTNTTQLATTAFVLANAGTTPDATATVKGIVKLAGDLGGTAALPTTPTAVHITGNETVNGEKTFTDVVRTTGLLLERTSGSTYQSISGYDEGFKFTDYFGDILNIELDALTTSRTLYAPDKSGIIAVDNELVHLTGNETIAGSKTLNNNLFFKSFDSSDALGSISRGDGGWHFTGYAGVYIFRANQESISIYRNNGSTTLGISASSISASRVLQAPDASGTIALTVNPTSITATAFYQSSDIRLKKIQQKTYSDVSKIRAIQFTWKDKTKGLKPQVGYSAQQVQRYIPNAVEKGEDGKLTVNYIQVLIAKIESLENRIKELEK